MINKINQMMTRALQCFQSGNYDEVELILINVLDTQPKNFDALHIYGVLKGIKNQHHEALEFFRKALRVNSNDSFLNLNIAKAFSEIGEDQKALKFHSSATKLNPNHPEGWLSYGKSLSNLKKFDESLNLFNKAVALNPDYAEAWTNLGCVLNKLGRFKEALDSFDKSLKINPYIAETWSNRGIALLELKLVEEAVASYGKAIAIKPDYAEAYSNRGNALLELKLIEEAVASFDKAIAIKGDYAEAYSNRGNALLELKLVEEAVASYERAIEINPDYAEAYWNKSLTLLLTGQFSQGWELYEWRWKRNTFISSKRDFPQPLWSGTKDIAGKTILLHAEQGLGDTIQFCRYAKLVKALGARVILEVPKALLGLLSGLEGVDELIEKGKVLPAHDYHCPLLSLPLAFKTDLTNIPSPKPYLAAAHQKLEEWAQRLGVKEKPRVGLVWSGSTGHKNDHNRSLTFQQLLPHLPNCCEYVSLQKEMREVDVLVLEGSGIRHYEKQLKDFTDTAALCELMDLVISVDTSVAHLAGALGKSTWVLLPYAPDWRWMLDRRDSPWYPNHRLFRQKITDYWISVFKEMETELKSLAYRPSQLQNNEKNICYTTNYRILGRID